MSIDGIVFLLYFADNYIILMNKEFVSGEHNNIPVKMEVLFANNETVPVESTLNVRVFWTKILGI